MENIANFLVQSSKRKLVDNKGGKDKFEDVEIEIIDWPDSLGFDLGIISTLNCKSFVNNELILLLKSPNV
jgi:hypothetical protein